MSEEEWLAKWGAELPERDCVWVAELTRIVAGGAEGDGQ